MLKCLLCSQITLLASALFIGQVLARRKVSIVGDSAVALLLGLIAGIFFFYLVSDMQIDYLVAYAARTALETTYADRKRAQIDPMACASKPTCAKLRFNSRRPHFYAYIAGPLSNVSGVDRLLEGVFLHRAAATHVSRLCRKPQVIAMPQVAVSDALYGVPFQPAGTRLTN